MFVILELLLTNFSNDYKTKLGDMYYVTIYTGTSL
jgi:hypothetical protein